ncbi:MAG: DUF4388 domain-containing protein [Desulfomonilaceae bacterium]|nr:DUF4388 domain-containing protein [Desulfomonilaceae bacterium]
MQTETEGYPEDLSEVMDFSRYDLRTTIRLIVLSGESRRVDVKRGSRKGSIFVREGEIYRVQAGDLEGDEAMFEILSWDKTIHSDFLQSECPERNIRIATQILLNMMESETRSIE